MVEDLLPHLVLRPVLPASARHGDFLLSGDLVPEPCPQRGFRKLTQKIEGGGDGSDRAGDIRALLHANKLSDARTLPAVQPRSGTEPGHPRWLLCPLSDVPVCGKPELPPGPHGLLLWIVPVPETAVQPAEVSEDYGAERHQSLIL